MKRAGMLFLETFSRFLGVLGTDHEKLTCYIRNTGSNYGKNPYRRGKKKRRGRPKQAKKDQWLREQEEKRPIHEKYEGCDPTGEKKRRHSAKCQSAA